MADYGGFDRKKQRKGYVVHKYGLNVNIQLTPSNGQ